MYNTRFEEHPQSSNKYGTRKKVIDFAKIGEKLSLTGSNCHYCKSAMTVKESNACRFVLETTTIEPGNKQSKRKTCNKKFCFDCLEKHFPLFWEKRNNKDWKCPCCSYDCTCVQCKKRVIKDRSKADRLKDSECGTDKETFSKSEERQKNNSSNYFLNLKETSNVSFYLTFRLQHYIVITF